MGRDRGDFRVRAAAAVHAVSTAAGVAARSAEFAWIIGWLDGVGACVAVSAAAAAAAGRGRRVYV